MPAKALRAKREGQGRQVGMFRDQVGGQGGGALAKAVVDLLQRHHIGV